MTEITKSGFGPNEYMRRLGRSYGAILAAGSLIGSFFDFLDLPMNSFNLFGAVKVAAQLRAYVSTLDSAASAVGSAFGPLAQAQTTQGHGAQTASAFLGAAPALYLIPVLSVVVIWAVVTGRVARRYVVAHGVLTVLALGAVYAAVSEASKAVGAGAAATAALGMGFWIILACGFGALAVGIGWIKGEPAQLLRSAASTPNE